MMNIESPQVLQRKNEKPDVKESSESFKIEVTNDKESVALKIVEDFAEYFPNHEIVYKGEQVFPGTAIDPLYLFNVISEVSKAGNATFSVKELNMQAVGDAFVKTTKNFGEDVENVKKYDAWRIS